MEQSSSTSEIPIDSSNMNLNDKEKLLLVLEKYSSIHSNLLDKISNLKYELDILNSKATSAETSSKELLKERNTNLVKKHSSVLVECLLNQDFFKFKRVITYLDYPINEFLYHTKYEKYNLLLLSTKLNLINFSGFLIRMGADVNITDKEDGWSSLMFAVQNKNKILTKLLLKNGADINHKDIDGFSVLAIVIDSINIEMCEMLLEYNPKIDNPLVLLEMLKANCNNTLFNIMKNYYFKQIKNDK